MLARLLCSLTLLPLASSLWAATATVVELKQSGCGPLDWDISSDQREEGEPGDIFAESLRVFFKDFHISRDAEGRSDRSCVMDARIKIPAGFRFRPLKAYAEGSYNIQPQGQSQGGIRVSYRVDPMGLEAERENSKKPFTGEGDILCQAELEKKVFTVCANHETYVNLHTDLSLWLNQVGRGTSLIELDTQRRDVDLAWDWQFQPCSNYFESYSFRSYIRWEGERSQAAWVRLYESGGEIVIGDQRGQIWDVVYSDDGRQVSGTWELKGERGRFQWTMVDPENGDFRGQIQGPEGESGDWFGYYASEGEREFSQPLD